MKDRVGLTTICICASVVLGFLAVTHFEGRVLEIPSVVRDPDG
jgi:hypothetical protein